jgi:hypothetical protein
MRQENKELLLEHLIMKIESEISRFKVDSNGEILHKEYSNWGLGNYHTLEKLMDIIKVYNK